VKRFGTASEKFSIFPNAAKLRDVALSANLDPLVVTLPWSQITNLTATLSLHAAVHILRNTKALKECRVTLHGSPPGNNFKNISLPCLQFLSLFDTGGGSPDLLSALALPVLKSTLVVDISPDARLFADGKDDDVVERRERQGFR
jgi:hypothetical protein